MLKILKTLFSPIYKNILYVALITGISLLVLALSDILFEEDNWMREFCKVAGTTILSGGVFMIIAKSYQFTNIFKDELRKVIYSTEYLDKRNDLDDIWLRVSESLCKQKFNTINDKVFKTVKNNYLPFEKEFFYKRFDMDTSYEFIDDDIDYISSETELDTDIVVDDQDGFNYHYSSTIPLPPNDNERTQYELCNLKINDETISDVIEKGYLKIKRTNTSLTIDFNYHIKGDLKEYKIVRHEKSVYHLGSNQFSSHSASWLYKMFNVRITYPKNLHIEWVDFGVLGRWTKTRRENNSHNILKANYNGLVFKNQGFMIIFRRL